MFTDILDLGNVGVEPTIEAISRIQADILGFSIFYMFSTCRTRNGKENGGIVTGMFSDILDLDIVGLELKIMDVSHI
jgi:hypothetical protein